MVWRSGSSIICYRMDLYPNSRIEYIFYIFVRKKIKKNRPKAYPFEVQLYDQIYIFFHKNFINFPIVSKSILYNEDWWILIQYTGLQIRISKSKADYLRPVFRIQSGSGFNQVSGSVSGFGIRYRIQIQESKKTHKNRKN